jgi:hypothetical protein
MAKMKRVTITPVQPAHRTHKFIYGAIIGSAVGTVAIIKQHRYAYVILAILLIVAAYAYLLSRQSRSKTISRSPLGLSPASIVGVLVIGVVAIAGAHSLDNSFACSPKGMIKKTVQDITSKSAVEDANTSSAALTVKPGDILSYSIAISNIAPSEANHLNDMASTTRLKSVFSNCFSEHRNHCTR